MAWACWHLLHGWYNHLMQCIKYSNNFADNNNLFYCECQTTSAVVCYALLFIAIASDSVPVKCVCIVFASTAFTHCIHFLYLQISTATRCAYMYAIYRKSPATNDRVPAFEMVLPFVFHSITIMRDVMNYILCTFSVCVASHRWQWAKDTSIQSLTAHTSLNREIRVAVSRAMTRTWAKEKPHA